MTDFLHEFRQTLPWRPRQALAALYWHVTGRRVRARNRLRHEWHLAPDAYLRWTRLEERNAERAAILAREIAEWSRRPLISVFCQGADTVALLAALERQGWPEWEVLARSDGGDLPSHPRLRLIDRAPGEADLEAALRAAAGHYLWPLEAGAQVPETALLRWVAALQDAPTGALVYADTDRLATDGCRREPWFKPEWHREMLLSQDYVSDCCLIPTTEARALLPLAPAERQAPRYALALALSCNGAAMPLHVPGILVHRGNTAGDENQAGRLAALAHHLRGSGAEVAAGPFATHRINWPAPERPPLVSLIVPTKDKAGLLRACVESVIGKTTWPACEILVIDNNSEEPETFALFAELTQHANVRVLEDRRPYNFSAINNRAVAAARGDYLCLLNNDTEVIAPEWLDEMMRQACRPQVGAVGAKLHYPDGSIQHAGVVIGMGNAAGHAHRLLRDEEPGYFAQAHIAREATAVTAACLVVEKRKFVAVGGLDEEHLAIAYNDVDLCLKLREAGWTNMYVPTARLYHHESVSRGDDFSPEHNARYRAELRVLQERWRTDVRTDPLHHPMLDRSTDQYVMAFRMDD
jgi:GT2 family glycosyltransferase